MFKFGGWKASLNFSGATRRREVYDNGPNLSSGGAYRSYREEFFGRNSFTEPTKKLTPCMVKLPPSKEIKSSKSANDLTDQNNLPPQLRKSSPDVSTDPRGGPSNNRGSSALYQNAKKSTKDDKKDSKDKKNAEKKQLAEQKKKEKAAQAQAKQDKLRIQRDKKIAEQQAKDVKVRKEKSKKSTQALPQATVTKNLVSNEAPRPAQRANPLAKTQYPSNTLESSISRTSGPPPYSEEPKPPEKQPNKKDATGNTSFSKPIENSSWDLISEHRSQINRNPVAGGSKPKQMVMNLQFSFDKAQADDRNNSEV